MNGKAYIVASRRSALGRLGGLHRSRRLGDLAGPVVAATLQDAKVKPSDVDVLIAGNTSEGGNPARLIALAAGLPDRVAAFTVDRQDASGLDAILLAIREIEAGAAEVAVAGGADAMSTAPWRLARPRLASGTPHVVAPETMALASRASPDLLLEVEAWARTHALTRAKLDAFAVETHTRLDAAYSARLMKSEIVPMKANADEARDESATGPSIDDFEDADPLIEPNGALTPLTTASLHDGASFAVIVSERVWKALGSPQALCRIASTSLGLSPNHASAAAMSVTAALLKSLKPEARPQAPLFELNESSAAEAILFAKELSIAADRFNIRGGALARGHAPAASGAILVTRLFSELIRFGLADAPSHGIASIGASGGQGVAALFEHIAE